MCAVSQGTKTDSYFFVCGSAGVGAMTLLTDAKLKLCCVVCDRSLYFGSLQWPTKYLYRSTSWIFVRLCGHTKHNHTLLSATARFHIHSLGNQHTHTTKNTTYTNSSQHQANNISKTSNGAQRSAISLSGSSFATAPKALRHARVCRYFLWASLFRLSFHRAYIFNSACILAYVRIFYSVALRAFVWHSARFLWRCEADDNNYGWLLRCQRRRRRRCSVLNPFWVAVCVCVCALLQYAGCRPPLRPVHPPHPTATKRKFACVHIYRVGIFGAEAKRIVVQFRATLARAHGGGTRRTGSFRRAAQRPGAHRSTKRRAVFGQPFGRGCRSSGGK